MKLRPHWHPFEQFNIEIIRETLSVRYSVRLFHKSCALTYSLHSRPRSFKSYKKQMGETFGHNSSFWGSYWWKLLFEKINDTRWLDFPISMCSALRQSNTNFSSQQNPTWAQHTITIVEAVTMRVSPYRIFFSFLLFCKIFCAVVLRQLSILFFCWKLYAQAIMVCGHWPMPSYQLPTEHIFHDMNGILLSRML